MFDVDGFRLHLLSRNKSKNTIKQRVNWLRRLKLPSLTKEALDVFVMSELERGSSPNYINQGILALRRYCQWADVAPDIQTYKYLTPKNTPAAILSEDEIEAFLKLEPTSRDNPKSFRTYSRFFTWLSYTGMRPGELANLTVNDIDPARKCFVLPTSKTNSPRLVPYPTTIEKDVLEALGGDKHYIFTTLANGKLKDRNWSREFSKRLARLEIKRPRLSCYTLRRQFITEMLDENVNLFAVQKIVGHKKATTTQKYYAWTLKSLKEAIMKHPRVRSAQSDDELMEAISEAVKDIAGKRFFVDVEHTKQGVKICVKKRGIDR